MWTVSGVRKNQALGEDMIKRCTDTLEESIKTSTRYYFSNNTFYDELPEKLKRRLVNKVLTRQMDAFRFFFCDVMYSYKAPSYFIVGVLTSLDSSLYEPGRVIIDKGADVDELRVVASGKCHLYGYYHS